MKAIVRIQMQLGSGEETSVFIPKEGIEWALDKYYLDAPKRLYASDLDVYGDQVTESEIDEDNLSAYVYAGDYSIVYETVEVETA